MSAKNGIVRLEDLPLESTCVKFPDELQKLMVKTALSITKGRYILAKALSAEPTTIYDFEKCRFKSAELLFVKKLSDFLVKNNFEEFSLENIETNLELIKTKWSGNCIFYPNFPIDFNCKEGSRIISGILFDGGITSFCYPFYTNNEEFLIDNIIKSVKTVVGNIEYNKRKYGNTFQVDFPKIFGYMLINGLEISPGSKLFNDPSIPKFIRDNPSLYKAFLQQSFDDEATVNIGLPNGGSKAIQLTQCNSKKEFPIRLIQLKELVENFDISVSGPYGPTREYKAKKGYSSYGWMIQITNRPDIRKFSELIGFFLPRKQQELNQLLSSYKLPPRFKKGTKFDEVLRVCKELKDKNKKITIKNVANKLNKGRAYTSELTCRMIKEMKLRVVKEKTKAKGFESGFEEKEFELIG